MVKVGAATETEMKEKKARVEDALHATRAAVEEGIVPGGGVALLRAQQALDGLEGDCTTEQRAGVQHRAPRDRGAAALDRRRTPGIEGSIVVDKVKERQGRVRLQRRDRGVRRPRARPA